MTAALNQSTSSRDGASPLPRTQIKLPSLTGSRFFAAFCVFIFHASLSSDLAPYADPQISRIFSLIVSKAGWLGVAYFFILSGFIMVWSARDGDTATAFYKRRVAKIYPTHFVTWCIAIALGAVALKNVGMWLSSLVLVNTWIDDPRYFFAVNRPSWSLCIEALFYGLFPMLFWLMKKLPTKFDRVAFALTLGAAILVQAYIYWCVEPNYMLHAFPMSEHQFWLSYIFPPPRLFEFVAGMFMARLLIHNRAPRIPKIAALALVLAAYIGSMFIPFQFGLSVVYILPVSLLIASLAQDDIARRVSFLSRPTAVWLGEISFGFYMVHFLVLYFFLNLIGERKFGFVDGSILVVVSAVLSVVCAAASYRFIEVPMMRRILAFTLKPSRQVRTLEAT